MPIEVVRAIAEKCKSGDMSASMKRFKARLEKERGKELSCMEFGEAVVSMKENATGSREARGGEGINGWALTTQAIDAQGGKPTTKPFWLNVMSPKSKVYSAWYGPVEIDEPAHIMAIDKWKGIDIEGWKDHNKSSVIPLNVDDVKYEVGKGLFFHMNPTDKKIHKALQEGTAKPSLHVKHLESDYDGENRSLTNYDPVQGLGIMIDIEAMDTSLGPREPELSEAIGGKNLVKEGEEQPAEPETPEQKPAPPAAPDGTGTPETTAEEQGAPASTADPLEKQLLEMQKQNVELLANLKKMQDAGLKKDELIAKTQEQSDKVERMLIDSAIEKSGIKKELVLVRKNMSYDDVMSEIEHIKLLREDLLGTEHQLYPPNRPTKKFDEKGKLTNDGYNALLTDLKKTGSGGNVSKEKKIFG